MALASGQQLADELERIAPYIERLKSFIRERDPAARFSLRLGHEPDMWELDTYLRADLVDDLDFWDDLAQFETDLLLDHDVAVATIRHPRTD
jgi:hypothetical protein